MLITGSLISLLIVLIIILCQDRYSIPVSAGNLDFFAGRMVDSKSLEKLSQEHWQWTMSDVPAEIPVDPKTNMDKCYLGLDSDGKVIFGIGAYATTYAAKCTMPSGMYFLVPLLVGECDATVPDPRGASDRIEEKWACAKDANEIFKAWEVVLDNRILFKNSGGEQINMDLKDQILVRNSSIFTLEIPENNRYEAPPGSFEAVTDGYWLLLNPLTPGEHELSYSIVHEQEIPGVQRPQQIPGKATYFLNVTG